jgi:hypothetical protein
VTPPPLPPLDVDAFVQRATGAAKVERAGRIQSLWGGYGELLRFRLHGAERATVVVKYADAGAARARTGTGTGTGTSRGDAETISHQRKCRSYDAETAFYRNLAPRCDEACRVAALLGAEVAGEQWILVLEDLDGAGFGRRERDPQGADLEACLGWLASFHARFLGERPARAGVWPVGTYWHLGTRQGELRVAATRDPTLTARAVALDEQLRSARFTTLVHGDAKPANFCFAPEGRQARGSRRSTSSTPAVGPASSTSPTCSTAPRRGRRAARSTPTSPGCGRSSTSRRWSPNGARSFRSRWPISTASWSAGGGDNVLARRARMGSSWRP